MDTSFHYLLMANQSILHKKLFIGLQNTPLTIGQPKILDYLKEHDGASQKDIAAGCHIEAPSLTSLLNRMEDKHLIERKMLNGNRRSYHIFLTEDGKNYQKLVEKSFLQLEQEAFKGFTEEECIQFMDMFLRIYNNLK